MKIIIVTVALAALLSLPAIANGGRGQGRFYLSFPDYLLRARPFQIAMDLSAMDAQASNSPVAASDSAPAPAILPPGFSPAIEAWASLILTVLACIGIIGRALAQAVPGHIKLPWWIAMLPTFTTLKNANPFIGANSVDSEDTRKDIKG